MISNGTTLLTSNEARELLGVSRVTFYRIVRKYNQLRIAKIAKRGKQELHYFDRNDVELLHSQRNPQAHN